MAINQNKSERRKEDFFSSLKLAEATIQNYKAVLRSKFLREVLEVKFGLQDIFEVTDLEVLWEIYSTVNVHPKNVEMHRICSAGIMKYIRFLNDGRRIGRRIDYKKPRPCMQNRRRKVTYR